MGLVSAVGGYKNWVS